jgi:nucleotide-binding universal stress UspA family protein
MNRIEIHRILYATDLSDSSHRAFEYSLALAAWYEAVLTALHVVPEPMVPASEAAYLVNTAVVDFGAQEGIRSALSAFVAPARMLGVRTEIEIREGKAAPQIVAMASELPADIVVMGTHGRAGFERLVLGSVAETVLRRVTCPVLTVPPHAPEQPSPLFYKSILCATDFSPASAAAVCCATALAEESGAALTLVHVLDPEKLRGLDQLRGVDEDRRPDYETAARLMLRGLLRDLPPRGFQAEEVVTSGAAASEILKLAGELHAGLIVMGVHGRGLLDLMAFGSVTDQVAREAACPVLSVRPRARELRQAVGS